ncbi:MAG TPA: dTDP-4-dehydrorhamnose 3,5-epimerase family protein [Chloroflexia bacterium]|nr:dTDP-4-dehydrorhamnose 3,5-epimerase family protein [Chloroflexia bacterium]
MPETEGVIEGVVVKNLVTHPDERGFFREVIRVTDSFFKEGFAQLSHALMHPGVAKAWHCHKDQVDWWYVPVGVLKVALYDTRPESPTKGVTQELFMGGEHGYSVLKIPPGVAHGCKAISGAAHLIYVTSRVYNEADEHRINHDDAEIGYDWVSGPKIK